MATGRPLTSSNAPLATFAGRAHRCTAGRMSRTLGLALRPIGLGLGRCRSWLPSSCSQGGCCSLDARTSSVAKQTARKWRMPPYSRPRAQFGGVARSSLHAELWGERRATSAQLCGSSAELCGALQGRCAQS